MAKVPTTVKNNGQPVMYKILALDLDGTLLNSQHVINPRLRNKIQALKDVIHIVLVTGRHHTAAQPYHRELGLDTPIICCNGTYIFDYSNNHVIERNSISKHHAREFIRIAEANCFKLVMYTKEAMLYSRTMPIDYMAHLKAWADGYEKNLRPNIRCVDNFLDELDKTEYIWKFVIEGSDLSKFDQLDFVKMYFSGERSWVDRIDYSNRGNSKGCALARYVKFLGYNSTQVVAVGDNHNDISMFDYAGLSIAMLNADEVVKQSAKRTTSADNNDEWVLAHLFDEIFSVT